MRKSQIIKFAILPIASMIMMQANAATPVNAMQHPIDNIQSLVENNSKLEFVETSREVDSNKTVHIRMQQTYFGYPVWGADVVKHIPAADSDKTIAKMHMNGMYYQNLGIDLEKKPGIVFGKKQPKQAMQKAIDDHMHKIGGNVFMLNKNIDLIVYIDKEHKAHWAYKISFRVPTYKYGKITAIPTYIMDALTLEVYKQWDDIKTTTRPGGGFGGNPKMGKLTYDGQNGHLPAFAITRDPVRSICKLHDNDVVVRNWQNNQMMYFVCPSVDKSHANLYWNGSSDQTNGSFSPSNDALFGGRMLKNMYKSWYNTEALINDDKTPMQLKLFVHDVNEGDNAHWDPIDNHVVLGDGSTAYYALTSIGVIGHEVSHGFTEQHSKLVYEGQSGAINEAFSDMAAQALEAYVYGEGKSSWQLGDEIAKGSKNPLRYMIKPSKDCAGKAPGTGCSIDNASQYYDGLDVHYGSGVYNRFFYLLATSAGWTVQSAFGVMVQANSHYWTKTTDFNSGACGVLQAATDLNMDLYAIKAAFDVVKVDYSNC